MDRVGLRRIGEAQADAEADLDLAVGAVLVGEDHEELRREDRLDGRRQLDADEGGWRDDVSADVEIVDALLRPQHADRDADRERGLRAGLRELPLRIEAEEREGL